jgi:urease accessory protein
MPSLAFAHVGVSDTSGITQGFIHPMSGIALVCGDDGVRRRVGNDGRPAALCRNRHRSFGCRARIIMASTINPPVAIAMTLVGFFAIFHGHAHGAEMPEPLSGLAYALGFIIASTMLHAVGIGWGLLASAKPRITQFAGNAIALAGIGMMSGLI